MMLYCNAPIQLDRLDRVDRTRAEFVLTQPACEARYRIADLSLAACRQLEAHLSNPRCKCCSKKTKLRLVASRRRRLEREHARAANRDAL